MAGKLTARRVETLTKPGRYSDGGNLYLRISPNGGKRWSFFYRSGGKMRDLGLGSAAKGQVSLQEARDESRCRHAHFSGPEPILSASWAGRPARSSDRTIPTFGAFADDYVKLTSRNSAMRSTLRNGK